MQITHEQIPLKLICGVVREMARQKDQESVAIEIANNYHALGGGELKMHRIDDPSGQSDLVRRNRLNLFKPYDGWLECRTEGQRQRVRELIPAILKMLPVDLAERLVVGNSLEYRALVSVRESIGTAIHTLIQTRRELLVKEYLAIRRGNGGPVGNALVH